MLGHVMELCEIPSTYTQDDLGGGSAPIATAAASGGMDVWTGECSSPGAELGL